MIFNIFRAAMTTARIFWQWLVEFMQLPKRCSINSIFSCFFTQLTPWHVAPLPSMKLFLLMCCRWGIALFPLSIFFFRTNQSKESFEKTEEFFLIQLGAAIKIHFFCWLFLAFFSYAFYSIFTYICSVLFDMISLSLDTSLEDFNQFFSFSFFLFFLYIFFPLTPCRAKRVSKFFYVYTIHIHKRVHLETELSWERERSKLSTFQQSTTTIIFRIQGNRNLLTEVKKIKGSMFHTHMHGHLIFSFPLPALHLFVYLKTREFKLHAWLSELDP